MNSNDLRRTRGIERANLVRRARAMSANDQVVLAAELATDPVERCPHLARYFGPAEICDRLVAERRYVRGRTNWSFNGCHDFTSGRNNEESYSLILHAGLTCCDRPESRTRTGPAPAGH